MTATFQIILYVANQEISRNFYSTLLKQEPILDVPGMTEFELRSGVKLGLMPEKGIAKILSNTTPHPELGSGIPRCELYFIKSDAQEWLDRSIIAGALMVSPMTNRDWGHRVGYSMDPDGHILAFAELLN